MLKPILKKKPDPLDDASFQGLFMVARDSMQKLYENAGNSQEDEDIFFDAFSQICEFAERDDPSTQDFLSYVFKKGYGDLIPSNYRTYMDWQFLAGANGNDFTIDKLKIFFANSYDTVLQMENAEKILSANNIDAENFEFELGKLFCDAMVDELGISAKKLVKRKTEYLAGSLQEAQKYDAARQKSLARVIDYLKKAAGGQTSSEQATGEQ